MKQGLLNYRAWHKEEKKLCFINTLTDEGAFLIGVKKGKDTHYDGGNTIVIAPDEGRFCKMEEIELMQCTDLKDIDGKDIFESDIVKYDNNIAMIIKMKYGWGVKNFPFEIALQNLREGTPETFEVIGNFYLDKNLLK